MKKDFVHQGAHPKPLGLDIAMPDLHDGDSTLNVPWGGRGSK